MYIPLPIIGAATTNISTFTNSTANISTFTKPTANISTFANWNETIFLGASITHPNATRRAFKLTTEGMEQATTSLFEFLSELPRGSASRPEYHVSSYAPAVKNATANGAEVDVLKYIADLCSGREDECGRYMEIFTNHSSFKAPMPQVEFVDVVRQEEAGIAATAIKMHKRSIADEVGDKNATPVIEDGDELANPGVIHPGNLEDAPAPPAMGQPSCMTGEKCMVNKPLAPPAGLKAMEGMEKRDFVDTVAKMDEKVAEWAEALWGGFVAYVLGSVLQE